MAKLYVAGPMTGLPEFNFPEFGRVAEVLRGWGHEVVSPHEVALPCGCKGDPPRCGQVVKHEWSEYLRADLIALLSHARGIALLEGWTNSREARFEFYVGRKLGMDIRHWARWEIS